MCHIVSANITNLDQHNIFHSAVAFPLNSDQPTYKTILWKKKQMVFIAGHHWSMKAIIFTTHCIYFVSTTLHAIRSRAYWTNVVSKNGKQYTIVLFSAHFSNLQPYEIGVVQYSEVCMLSFLDLHHSSNIRHQFTTGLALIAETFRYWKTFVWSLSTSICIVFYSGIYAAKSTYLSINTGLVPANESIEFSYYH